MGCQGLFFNCLQIRVCGAISTSPAVLICLLGFPLWVKAFPSDFWFLGPSIFSFGSLSWSCSAGLAAAGCLACPFLFQEVQHHWRCCLWGFPFAILVLLQRFGKNKQNTHCFHFAHIRILLKNFNKRVPWWDLNFWEFRFDLQKNVCDTEKTGDWETR